MNRWCMTENCCTLAVPKAFVTMTSQDQQILCRRVRARVYNFPEAIYVSKFVIVLQYVTVFGAVLSVSIGWVR